LCRQQGIVTVARQTKRAKRTLRYLLDSSGTRIRLVKRKSSERLMPNMWELPTADNAGDVSLRLRHSITSTDYTVEVRRGRARSGKRSGKYVSLSELTHLPLTGLTRKILRKSALLA
jgi:adenine-specific DNA glycosylase